MNKSFLKLVSLSAVASLPLAGCVTYGWPIITSGDDCGTITLEGTGSQYPDLFLNSDISGDVGRLSTSVEFSVDDLPPYYAVDPDSDEDGPVYAYGVPSLPVGWIAEAQAATASDDVLNETGYVLGDQFIYGYQQDMPAALSINASNNFVYSSSLTQEQVIPDEVFYDLLSSPDTLPFLYSFFHLPATLITSCGQELAAEDFLYEENSDISSDINRFPARLGRSSSLEIYPGYVEDLIDFRSEPLEVSFASAQEGDGRIALAASVVPWFSGFEEDLLGEGPDVDLGLDQISEFERFWITQLIFFELILGSQEDQLQNVFTFLNPGAIEQGVTDETPRGFSADLEKTLTEDTYFDLFLASINRNLGEFDSPVTREELKQQFGDLSYLFVYTIFIEEMDDGRVQLSYSFDRYYPGVAGDLVTQEVFAEQQSFAASYTGPVITKSLPSLAAAGDVVEFVGTGLDQVTGISIDSKKLELVSVSQGSIKAKLPLDLTSGMKDLVVSSSAGSLTVQDMLRVSDVVTRSLAGPKTSIKKMGSDLARVQLDSVVGAGKVQVLLNGKEVAWVKTSSLSDAKLKAGRMVRTLKLSPGVKNVIEVLVDGERVKRVAYKVR